MTKALTPGLHPERLKHIRASYEASKQGHAFIGHPSYDEEIAIIDALLAAYEQDPVYQVCKEAGVWVDIEKEDITQYLSEGEQVRSLFTHTAPSIPTMPAGLHPDTQKLVADFSTALAEKLYKAQLKYGYSDNWKRGDWSEQCLQHFQQHISKGDPRDVAAYCAFMWFHGWSTALPAPSIPVVSFYRDGIAAAADWVDAQREAYDNEHGQTYPVTGSFEFSNDAQLEYSSTLAEIAEGIRALHPNATSAPSIPAAVQTFDEWSRGCKFQLQLCYPEYRELAEYTWNEACRAAMLQAEPVSQPYKLPDGYVLVPVEPTVEMRKSFHQANDEAERFVSPDHQWQAMLAAAPEE